MKEDTYTIFPNVVLEKLYGGDLSKPAIKLYLFLRRYKNQKNGHAWVGYQATLREMTISRNDIKSAKNELVAAGLITDTERFADTNLIEFLDVVPVSTVETAIVPTEETAIVSTQGSIQLTVKSTTENYNSVRKSKYRGRYKRGVVDTSIPKEELAAAEAAVAEDAPSCDCDAIDLGRTEQDPPAELPLEYRIAMENLKKWEQRQFNLITNGGIEDESRID